MLRYGQICEQDPAKGLFRVEFDDDGIVSDWMPLVMPAVAEDSYFVCPDIGSHVACLMDKHIENGVILGSLYSQATAPKQAGKDIASVVFKDGSKVVFDRAAGSLTVETKGDITVKTAKNTTIEAAQTVLIKAANGATIEANTEIKGQLTVIGGIQGNGDLILQGNLSAGGNITAQGDILAGIISLLFHKHPTAPTGPPSPPIP